jgi:hypothetical protein
MVMSRVETLMGRRQIARMIEDDPITVVLYRRVRETVPGGGWRFKGSGVGDPLRAQRMRLIPFKRRITQQLVSTELGELTDLPYILLGYHDADIQRGDYFRYNGDEFEVRGIDIAEPEIKTVCEVDYYGKKASTDG